MATLTGALFLRARMALPDQALAPTHVRGVMGLFGPRPTSECIGLHALHPTPSTRLIERRASSSDAPPRELADQQRSGFPGSELPAPGPIQQQAPAAMQARTESVLCKGQACARPSVHARPSARASRLVVRAATPTAAGDIRGKAVQRGAWRWPVISSGGVAAWRLAGCAS